MRLPFGLDFKSIVVTLVFVYLVWPFAQQFMASRTASE